MKRTLSLLLVLFVACAARSAATDSIRFSLLTCGPGEEIYSLFGHTAIRYENPAERMDVVFNYGIFDFNAPHFMLRFTLGKTDYLLGATNYYRFIASYAGDGREVWEQPLNLTDEEKLRLLAQLKENYRPENRMYRYNFFYDNCATRPRDQIERALEGERLAYAEDMTTTDTGVTFRDMVHRCTEGHPWARFGIDLCLGYGADRPISRREMMFVPLYLKDCFAGASIVSADGSRRPLAASMQTVVQADSPQPYRGITPLQAALLLLAVVCVLSLYGLKRGKTLWGVDLLLFAAAGLGGCLLAFMAAFSEHPTVDGNLLLFFLHPLHLFCLPWMINKVRKGRKSRYMLLNSAVLTLFILTWPVNPQEFDAAVLPLALCLMVRSVSNLLTDRKRRAIPAKP